MIKRQIFRALVSLALVVLLLTPDVARAMQPGTSAVASSRLAPRLVVQASGIQQPADIDLENIAARAIETDLGLNGQLLFAPAMDRDGDPSTNPLADSPIPVIRMADKNAGLVGLAVQVGGLTQGAQKINVPVTFWIWESGPQDQPAGLVYSSTLPTDAWGAVRLEVPLKRTWLRYVYQASAPGFGSTEMRAFQFDPTQAIYTIHNDGAVLHATPLGQGQVRLVLESTRPMQAGRDQPALILSRRPDGKPVNPVTGGSNPSPVQPVFDALNRNGGGLPFPRVMMQITGPTTAQVDIQLPAGEYRFLGAVDIFNAQGAQRIFSNPVQLQLDAGGAHPTGAPVWVADLEHDTNRRLVRYQAGAGKAVFDLVRASETPVVASALEGESLLVKSWRTGPFEYQQETYAVKVNRPAAGAEIAVSLDNLDYDPVAGRYTLDFKSQDGRPITGTLHIQAFGATAEGSATPVEIWSQSSQVVLHPGQVSSQQIEIPMTRGRPEGIQATLSSPETTAQNQLLNISLQRSNTQTRLLGMPEGVIDDGLGDFVTNYYSKMVVVGRSIEKFFKEHTTVTLKFYLELLEVEIISWGYQLPPGQWARNPESLDAATLFWQIFDSVTYQMWLDQKVALVTGGVQTAITFSGKLDFGAECQDGAAKEILRQSITGLANQLNHIAEQIPMFAKSIPPGDDPKYKVHFGPGPFFLGLMWWLEGQAGVRAVISAEAMSLIIGGQVFADFSVNIGWEATLFQTAGEYKSIYAVFASAWGISRLATALGSAVVLSVSGSCGKVEADGTPADDRQDAWQNASTANAMDLFGQSLDTLASRVKLAREMGLWRAERALTLELRQMESEIFNSDTQATLDYYRQVDDISRAANQQVRGILQGTIPISPSQTITDAIFMYNQQGVDALLSLPYTAHQKTLDTNLEIAQQAYAEMYGQELEIQHELRLLQLTGSVGVINTGFPQGALQALEGAGVPAQLISLWPGAEGDGGELIPYLAPQDAPRAVVLPSGGMAELSASAEVRAWLEAYVSGGGILVVFSQAFGSDWQSLPGGKVRGVGYNEDQRCEQESVRGLTPSNWLVWMGEPTPDIQVDGVFTAWPANATLLLARTTGTYQGFPAMLEYPYGQGRVLATSAYGDWAVQSAIFWGDDWQMTRSVLIRAYLLATGRDVDDVQVITPDTDFDVSIPLTNETSFPSTMLDVWLPKFVAARSISTGLSNTPLALDPGQSTVITTTLHAPRVMRNVHNWTEVGLFPVRTRLTNDLNASYQGVAGFVLSQSPLVPAPVSLLLTSSQPSYLPFTTATVSAVVRNHTAASQSVTLRGSQGLPTTPIVLDVPAFGEVVTDYPVVMDSSKALRATIRNAAGTLLGDARLSLYINAPRLQATPLLTAPLENGRPITVTVTNQPVELSPAAAAISTTVVISLTSPGGVVLWTDSQLLPPLAQSQSAALVFTSGDPGPVVPGIYQIAYHIYENNLSLGSGAWPVPADLVIPGRFDKPQYRVGDTVVFTATLLNPGYFDLDPLATIEIPDLGISATQQFHVPAGGQAPFPFTFTLPLALLSQTYPVQISADQNGVLVTQTHSFSLEPEHLVESLSGGPNFAGQAITLTLENTGGGGTGFDYVLQLADKTGAVMAQSNGSRTVQAGELTTLVQQIPAQAASGEYRLQLTRTDHLTLKATLSTHLVQVAGMAAGLDVYPNKTEYLAGETVQVSGAVSAAQGTLSGTLVMNVSQAGTTSLQTIESGYVSSDDEGGYLRDHRLPAVAVDAAGNAYAVSLANPSTSFVDLLFSYRPAGGRWALQDEKTIAALTADGGSTPSIAVDASGKVFVVWEDNRPLPNGSINNIYLRVRSVDGVWGPEEKVNDVISAGLPDIALDPAGNAYILWTNWGTQTVRFTYRSADGVWGASELVSDVNFMLRGAASLAVDAAGNAYAVWEDVRSADDIYFSYRPSGGVWSANSRINDNATNSVRAAPAIAVTPDGTAWAVWRDQRSGVHIYAASRPAGGAWGANVRVSTTSGVDVPDVSVDTAGNVYAVWASTTPDIFAAVKPVAGAWGAPQRVDDSTRGAQSNPAIASSPSGATMAVWDDGRNFFTGIARFDIYASLRPAGGSAWGANSMVTRGGGALKANPSLAVDSAGNIYSSFTDYRYNDQNIYFNSHAANGAWDLNARADDGPGTTQQSSPSIGVAPNGDTYLVWEDYRSGASNADIRFAFRPAGGSWGASLRVNDDAGTSMQTSPVIAVDGNGNALAIWKDYRNSLTAPDVYSSYRPAGGAWGPGSPVNDFPAANVANLDLAVDAAGNAFVIWNDQRSGVNHVYSAYRPAGGAWGANQQVDDAPGAASDASIAMLDDGTAYALWVDQRTGVSLVYFATRPAGGLWSASQAVESNPDNLGRSNPNLVVDPSGIVYAGWNHPYLFNGFPTNRINLAARLPGAAWSAAFPVNYPGLDFALALAPGGRLLLAPCCVAWGVYTFSFGGDQPLWSQTIPVNTSTSQAVNETAGTLGGLPGKYWLQGSLQNPLGQSLAATQRPFYIYPPGVELTLETDKPAYKPGETITVTGRVTNTLATTATLTLALSANSQTILNQAFTLAAGQGTAYSASHTSNQVVFFLATAGAAQAGAIVPVAAAQVSAALHAPNVAGYDPISATLTYTNTGRTPVNLEISLAGGPPQPRSLAPGEVGSIQQSVAITHAATLTATLQGDVNLILSRSVGWGLGGDLALIPPQTGFSGPAPVGYVITTTGELPTPAMLSYQVDGGASITATVSLLPGERFTGSLLVDTPAGRHTLQASLLDDHGVLLDAAALEWTVDEPAAAAQAEIQILEVTVAPGPAGPQTGCAARAPGNGNCPAAPDAAEQVLQVAATIANRGAAVPVIAALQVFAEPQQWVITPLAYMTQTYTFTLDLPADLPAGSYPGQISIFDQHGIFNVPLSGPAIDMSLAMGPGPVAAGQPVDLHVTLSEQAGISADYHLSLRYLDTEEFITVTVPANQVVEHIFTFTASETARASVALSFTPLPPDEGQRTIMIDSLPVQVGSGAPGVSLQLDKPLYYPGETISLTASITGTHNSVVLLGPVGMGLQEGVTIAWSPPYTPEGLAAPGDYPLAVNLPAMVKTGQYHFMILVDGQTINVPFDVHGLSVTSRRVILNKATYNPQDNLEATVEILNNGPAPVENLRLTAWLFLPEDPETGVVDILPLSPAVSQTVSLQPGLNVFHVSGEINTPVVGAHMLGVMIGVPGQPWEVVRSFTQLAVGGAHLVSLTSDHGIYAPGQPGVGRLDVYGVGPATLVVTSTTGATLLNTQAVLSGYTTYTFPIPTDLEGETLLAASSLDAAGNRDYLLHAYAVPEPVDVLPPVISLLSPGQTTHITSNAFTMTLPVSGVTSDNSTQVNVTVNGIPAAVSPGGEFNAEIIVRRGLNIISASAYDQAGNLTYAPVARVYVLPAYSVQLTALQPQAAVGDLLTFQVVLASGANLNDVDFHLPLPSAMVSNVAISASNGTSSVNTLVPGIAAGLWLGDLAGGAPTTLTMTATAAAVGVITATAGVNWGWGLQETITTSIVVEEAAEADLSIAVQDAPDPVYSGEPLTYTVAIQNLGPGGAAGVTLNYMLPGSVTYLSASQGCSLLAAAVQCEAGWLADNDSKNITITVIPTQAGELPAVFTVNSSRTDGQPANNTVEATTTVVLKPTRLFLPLTIK